MRANPEGRSIDAWKLLVMVMCAALACAALAAMARPALAGRPPRPMPTPRPTPTPKPVVGGAIQLHVEGTSLDALETLVQWQDGLGQWHDVEGWRGALDETHDDWGQKTWWVSPEHFDAGPFHWVVQESGQTAVVSSAFYLPARHGEMVRVVVALEASLAH